MHVSKKLKILLFEDLASDAELVKLQLEESGLDHEVRHARNKNEFIAYLDNFNPHLILSDYGIPGFNGLQALEYLKETEKDIPFILVTGTLGEEKAVETILSGASDFLLKENLHNLHATIVRSIKAAEERRARKDATEALIKKEEYFRGLIENNHDPIFTFNHKNEITYASPSVKSVLNYEAWELIGVETSRLLHPDDWATCWKEFEKLLKGEIQLFTARLRVVRKDGEHRWVEAKISDRRQVNGIGMFVSNFRDIHEQVQTDMQLKEKNQLLDAVIKNLREGLIVADMSGKVVLHNKVAENILGMQLSDYVFSSSALEMSNAMKADLVTGFKPYELPMFRTIKGKIVDDEEVYMKNSHSRKGGIHLSINGSPLKGVHSNQVIGGVVSFRDITEKKKYQAALEKTLGQLEQRVKERTQELLKAHTNLAQAHKLMTYSINYAKRIQQAILPSEEDLRKIFERSFLIFSPRDIVSGDFVWLHNDDDNDCHYFAVADCTGHGVPGAMMSMIGSELLDRIVVDQGVHAPGSILDTLDKSVTGMLRKGDKMHKTNDGMDMSFCVFDRGKGMLTFAGAHNDGLLVRKGEIITLRASRRSIGGMMQERCGEFDEVSVKMEAGDRAYLFTDGFSDQFGGPNAKKFMKKRLIELIIDIQHFPMHRQEEIIQHKFDQWKGDEEQIDDVTLAGIEL